MQQDMFGEDCGNAQSPERFTLTEEQLRDRLVDLERQKANITADISQVKKDASFHKEDNPKGIDKEEVKKIHKAAKLFAANDFEEKRAEALATFGKYEDLFDYDN